jgi:osmotically-inducible protein OsmY
MVTLFGAVDDKPSRDMAEKVASGVDGVSMVHNNLAVAAGS